MKTNRVQGSNGVSLMECVHPSRNIWRVRWDVRETGDGMAEYMEAEFGHKPTRQEVMDTIFGWINGEVDKEILKGFCWKGRMVWLSAENQRNYSDWYALRQTLGYPMRIRGDDGYIEIADSESMESFYKAVVDHILECVADGWRRKDGVDLTIYEI